MSQLKLLADLEHISAAMFASNTISELAILLPENDLVIELQDIVEEQFDILMHVIEDKHYGSDRIEEFNKHLVELEDQLKHLKSLRGKKEQTNESQEKNQNSDERI